MSVKLVVCKNVTIRMKMKTTMSTASVTFDSQCISYANIYIKKRKKESGANHFIEMCFTLIH